MRVDSFRCGQILALAVTVSVLSFGCKRAEPTARSLTAVSYGGGAYQQSHKDAFFKPFEDFTGTHIEAVVWNAEYGKLKAMVDGQNVTWDVVEVTDAQFKRGKREGLFSKLTVKPSDGEFLPSTVDDYGVANVYWGTVLAYLPESFPKKQPRNWKDFWDVKGFPGPRALYDDPRGNLEFALLADGVPKDQLYPIDVVRAFRKLDEIKPHVRVFWTEGTQAVQLLQSKSVVLTPAWNGRIFALAREGTNIHYSWDGAALELDWWIVPKGSKSVDAASRFILFASLPERMAKQASQIGYGPVNKSSLECLPEVTRRQLPTFPENWERSFVVNSDWWAEHELEVTKRWLAWKSKK